MLDFFKTFFRPIPPSGTTAKERLRLVLLSDHLSLAPDVVEALKRDLIEVISRYVEIDREHTDVSFEHREREIAMLASIPITGLRDRERPLAPPPPTPPVPRSFVPGTEFAPPAAPEPAPVPAVPELTPVVVAPPPLTEVPAERPIALELVRSASATEPVPAEPIQGRSANARPPRRRRRKKAKQAAAGAAAATG